MSVDYLGLMAGTLSPIEVAKLINKLYGGASFSVGIESMTEGHYTIRFTENPTEAERAKPPWRRKPDHRLMHFWTDGACKGDYAHITTEPMTLVSLGRHGDCAEIIRPLANHYGGYLKDEVHSHEWKRAQPIPAESGGGSPTAGSASAPATDHPKSSPPLNSAGGEP